VIFGSADGRLYILDLRTGEKLWSYEIGSPIYSTAAVVDGLLIVGAKDGGIYAFGSK
jgi:outer membrane protein assembly factor BamB